MKKLLILGLSFLAISHIQAQTALEAGEIRHNSFVARVDAQPSTNYRLQVARDAEFTDFVVEDRLIVSTYAADPYHQNSSLRIGGLQQNTTYYYRFSINSLPYTYESALSVTTWDPPNDPTPIQPLTYAIDEITLNWRDADPTANGHEIVVYIDVSACADGTSYNYENSIVANQGETSKFYDFFFPEDASYLFSIRALNDDFEYGPGNIFRTEGCDCYSSLDLSTFLDDKEIHTSGGGTSFRIRNDDGSNWSPTNDERYLNYVWTLPSGWEMSSYNHFAINAIKGFSDGNITVKLVNPCTGAESDELSVAVLGEKQDQTITFNSLPTKTYGDASFSLTGTASSGLTVSYESSNNAVASISGSTVTINGAGTATITASQDGDSQYNPASDVPQTLTVNKANQSITFGALSDVKLSDGPITLMGSASSTLTVNYSSSNTSIADVSGDQLSLLDLGTIDITASQVGNSNYNAANDVVRSLTVIKGDQVITFGGIPSKNINSSDFTLPSTTSAGLTISYVSSNTDVATVSGNTVSVVGAGTSNITASQSGNTQYNAATPVMQTLTVTKLPQTISDPSLTSMTYGDSPLAVYLSATSGLEVTISSSDENIVDFDPSVDIGSGVYRTYLNGTGAGTVTITMDQAGDGTYEAAQDAFEFTVNKADQTITFNSLSDVAVTDADFDLSASSTSGLDISYSSSNTNVATVSGSTVSLVGTGTTTITASQSGDGNYNAASSVQRSLTVTKGDQTITFNALSAKSFGDANFSLGATASSGLTVSYSSNNSSVATVSGNTVTITGVGTTTITASQGGNTSYNAASDVPRTLTVNKASQTITFGTLADKAFGDANFNLSGTASSGLSVNYSSSNTAVATVSGSTVQIVGVGTTTITASQSGNTNYEAASDVGRSLTVVKADQNISFSEIESKEIGSDPFDLNATSSSGLMVSYSSSDESVATVSGSTVTIVGTGSTTITADQHGNANYNAASSVGQTLTVTLLNQTITFGDLSAKTYGDADFDLTASASSGLSVSFESSDATIATVSGTSVSIKKPGTVTITASQTGNATYEAAQTVEKSLTIEKADQTIAFESLTEKTMGDSDFDLSAESTSGLSVSYSTSDSDIISISGKTVTILADGTATINASQSGDDYYNSAETISRELVIQPAKTTKSTQEITFSTLGTKTYGDPEFDLSASSSSGLAVVYSSSDETMLKIDGSKASILSAGKVTITASQAGNDDYESAQSSQELTINKSDQEITIEGLPASGITKGENFTITATATSGLEVSLEISGPGLLDGSTITPTAAGTLVITASQSGNNNYLPAETVTLSIDVAEAVVSSLLGDAQLRVYPNPVTDILHIEGIQLDSRISLFDLNGKLMLQRVHDGQPLNLQTIPRGQYLLKLESGKSWVGRRIVIDKN